MTRTYDELELLPKVVPSARHANRTLCCDITAADHETGKKLSRTMKEVYGDATLPNDKIVILFRGAAGDRFGTGLGSGITFVADKIGANGCADMNGGRALILSLPREGVLPRSQKRECVCLFQGHGHSTRLRRLYRRETECIRESRNQTLVEEHQLLTHSKESSAILSDWNESDCGFVRVSATV